MKKAIGKMTELEMRDYKEKWPKTEKALFKHVRELLAKEHDYGTCVYAVSLATSAMFNYMGHKLGISGFQAGCADLDFLKRRRGLDDGFMILDYNKLLYPQYFNDESFPDRFALLKKNLKNIQNKAKELLEKKRPRGLSPHPHVEAHWNWILTLANGKEKESKRTLGDKR